MEKAMGHPYRFFLTLLCLFAINMESKAQKKCGECPNLKKDVTLICIGRVCSAVIGDCKWVSRDNPVAGQPIIESDPMQMKDISKCTYKTKGGQEINFHLEQK